MKLRSTSTGDQAVKQQVMKSNLKVRETEWPGSMHEWKIRAGERASPWQELEPEEVTTSLLYTKEGKITPYAVPGLGSGGGLINLVVPIESQVLSGVGRWWPSCYIKKIKKNWKRLKNVTHSLVSRSLFILVLVAANNSKCITSRLGPPFLWYPASVAVPSSSWAIIVTGSSKSKRSFTR